MACLIVYQASELIGNVEAYSLHLIYLLSVHRSTSNRRISQLQIEALILYIDLAVCVFAVNRKLEPKAVEM